jgi:hypothetical protein
MPQSDFFESDVWANLTKAPFERPLGHEQRRVEIDETEATDAGRETG